MSLGKAFSGVRTLLLTILFFLIASPSEIFGQATGGIVGSISDTSSARMVGVTVKATHPATGAQRSTVTNETGAYGFSSLTPGEYNIAVEMTGFKATIKHATVNVGRDVTVDFGMELGEIAQAINVAGEASAINLVDSKVDGIVERSQIRDLPLNGSNAYEMAKLVPGVRVESTQNRNADNLIFIAGQDQKNTRVATDGINVSEVFGGGGEGLNFSNEVVQEFQVSINNSDPSVGISSGGAVNMVTRSGTNELHGTLSGFFRNNQYAAFPGLSRPVPKPNPTNDPAIADFNQSQTDPTVWRRQIGGTLGGPLLRDRLFGFASVDVARQEAAATFDTNVAELAAFNRIANYPRERTLQTYRIDWHATATHSLFVRFSRDTLYTRTSGSGSLPATHSSLDVFRNNKSYLAMMAWTAAWSPSLVGDVRVGFTRWGLGRLFAPEAVQEAQLFAPSLPRLGDTTVSGVNMRFGAEMASPHDFVVVQPQVVSNFTYLRGNHTWKFGMTWSPVRTRATQLFDFPYRAQVFTPAQARQAGIPVPSTFTTIGDLLQLPLRSIVIPAGKNYTYPYTFAGDGHDVLWAHQIHAYLADSFKATKRLTLNWSAAWNYDPLTSQNYDMPRPASIARLFGGGELDTQGVSKKMFSPSVGFAWNPRGDGKTAIRGGFGIYYGTAGSADGQRERSVLAPVGNGYLSVPGSFITNPKTGTGILDFGSAAANAAAGVFRLADILPLISGIRANLEQTVFTGTNRDFSVTNLDYFKANASNAAIFAPHSPPTYSTQSMVGVQRRIGDDWLFDATTIYNVTNQKRFTWDANRQFRPVSAGGPVIPAYAGIVVSESGGKAVYRGLLLSVKKRMTRRYQISAAYTLSSAKETVATLVDYNDRKSNFGFSPTNRRHILNITATVELPWGFQMAVMSQVMSKTPFNVFLSGIDLNGDGTTDDRLPGVPQNGGNLDVSAGDFPKVVTEFNQTYAGKRDARGTLIPSITLPGQFSFGDTSFSQDMRIAKRINLGERVQVNLIGEVFNLLNIANLSYPSSATNVLSSGFGQPGGRFGNLFGSEGPRAFQFAARLSF